MFSGRKFCWLFPEASVTNFFIWYWKNSCLVGDYDAFSKFILVLPQVWQNDFCESILRWLNVRLSISNRFNMINFSITLHTSVCGYGWGWGKIEPNILIIFYISNLFSMLFFLKLLWALYVFVLRPLLFPSRGLEWDVGFILWM